MEKILNGLRNIFSKLFFGWKKPVPKYIPLPKIKKVYVPL
jgi:hypothetical protein